MKNDLSKKVTLGVGVCFGEIALLGTGRMNRRTANVRCQFDIQSTELAKKVCPRLRDSACWRGAEITQPRTNFFGQLCMRTRVMLMA